MKEPTMLLLPFVIAVSPGLSYAQEGPEQQPPKWGEIPQEHLDMDRYAPDSSAAAVILADYGKVFFEDDLDMVFERHTRIKILTEAGYEWGNVTISYLAEDRTQRVKDIEGRTYYAAGDGRVDTHKMAYWEEMMRPVAIAAVLLVVACGEASIEPQPLLQATGSYSGFWTFNVHDADHLCEETHPNAGRHLCEYGFFAFPGHLEIVRENSSTLAGHFTIDTASGRLVRDPFDLEVWGPDTTRHGLGLHFADAGLIDGCASHGIEDDPMAGEILVPLEFKLGRGTRQDVENLIGCSLLEQFERWEASVQVRIIFDVPHEERDRRVTLVIASPDGLGVPQQSYEYLCGDKHLLIHSSFDTESQLPFELP
jgi:hypothetical protein